MGIVDIKNSINVVSINKYGDGIGTIRINGIPFKGASPDSLLGWEEFVWSTEPTRNNTFAFENMDDIEIGLVAQCSVNFKYFNIQDFMKFREAIKQRYFYVDFFNVDTGEWEYNREMYCSKNEKQKLHYFNPTLLGVTDFSITLVATNRDRIEHEPITITYNANGYNINVSSPIQVDYSTQYYVDEPQSVTNYEFVGWNTKSDGSGWLYKVGQSFTAFKDVTLYAIYKEI